MRKILALIALLMPAQIHAQETPENIEFACGYRMEPDDPFTSAVFQIHVTVDQEREILRLERISAEDQTVTELPLLTVTPNEIVGGNPQERLHIFDRRDGEYTTYASSDTLAQKRARGTYCWRTPTVF